jgi:hypothetical protein
MKGGITFRKPSGGQNLKRLGVTIEKSLYRFMISNNVLILHEHIIDMREKLKLERGSLKSSNGY